MKLKHLIYRVEDAVDAFFKGKRKKILKNKPVLFALIFVLALAMGFFLFHAGVKAPEQGENSALQLSAIKNTPSVQPSGQAPNFQKANMKLEIIPGQAYVNTVLKLSASGFGLDDQATQVQWMVNGVQRISDSPLEFDTKDLSKGDVVQAAAFVNGVEVESNSVTIGDAPLEIVKVKLMPEVFKPGDTLYVEAHAADSATNIVYEWSVNGNFAGNSNSLAIPVKRGDQIAVKITPCGAQGCGQPIVLQRRIANMPPMFDRQVSTTFDGVLYTAQLSATDPDGDTLTYALENAPAGMTIGASSGLIEWKVPPGLKSANVTVTANDGHGGTSRMTINIKPQ
ncbi:MAG: Ig domain-containing protein [Nitrospiraceae bacterium]|nr:Ig domain-containing protein [Nitrospiraceae bacterium]